MPAAVEYDPNDKDLRQEAATELNARRTEWTTNNQYYAGKHKKYFSEEKQGKQDRHPDNVVVNMVKQTVDRVVAFLSPSLPVFEMDATQDTTVEQWLRQAWKDTGGAKKLAAFALNGCLSGHCYGRILPGTNGKTPRIIALNPANVVVFWQADDVENPLWYEVHWEAGKVDYRQDIYQVDGGWTIADYRREKSSSQLAINEGWQLRSEMVWEYNTLPIVSWQHRLRPNDFYGAGECDNRALNDHINAVASLIKATLRNYTAPRTVGTGFKADGLVQNAAIDTFWTIDNPDAKVFNLEMQSDLGSSMNTLNFLTAAYLTIQRVVVLKGDVADFQRVTNLGMKALFVDMLGLLAELQRNYETGLVELSRGLLEVGGMGLIAPGAIQVNWADPLPVDPKETLQVTQGEREMGVISKETASRKLGLDPKVEAARMEGEVDQRAQVVEKMMVGGDNLTP